MDKSFLSSWNFWSILFCFIFFFFFFQWETYGFCITEGFFGLRIKCGVTEGSSCESLWSFLRKPLVIPAKAFGHSCESLWSFLRKPLVIPAKAGINTNPPPSPSNPDSRTQSIQFSIVVSIFLFVFLL